MTTTMQRRAVLLVLIVATAALARGPWPAPALAQRPGVVFESNWGTATGTSSHAITDGGRWSHYWEFNGGSSVQLLSVVPGALQGRNALRVEQRGSAVAANLQVDDFVPPSQDYYLRFYMRNDDTSGAGDHIVTVDTYRYANLTFVRKYGSAAGWRFDVSVYGCGYTYPIGHWGPARRLANGEWYRFEYHVDFVGAGRVQVHPRVYDMAGNLILSDADFRQTDFGSSSWAGRSDWTLASYYAAGHSFCVEPGWVNDFGLGNNGQQGASATGAAWYFGAVQIRTDTWPGPVDASGATPPATAPPDASTPPPAPEVNLSSRYPGDVGIEHDPDVVFAEQFEQPALADVLRSWTDVLRGSTMRLTRDVPAGSPGTQSLEIPWAGGGASDGGHLYKHLVPGVDTALYVRYYIKHPVNGAYRHVGVWTGGHNPPLPWPNPQAGMKPSGSDRFIAAAEQSSFSSRLDHYNYWADMRRSGDGQYWGNHLLNDPSVRAAPGEWTCVEHMVRLNEPGAFDGEHAIWVNGRKVSHLGPGMPNGSWSGGIFTQAPHGQPFEGFRWRTDPALNLNWIWLQNYSPDNPAGSTGGVKFDHVVAATRYIGCLAASADAMPDAPAPPPAGAPITSGLPTHRAPPPNAEIVGWAVPREHR